MRAPAGTVLIVGAGLAGSRCAEARRSGGHLGRILLVGDEPLAPYERPALSKGFLAGSRSPASLALRGPSHWSGAGIELGVARSITAIDPRGFATTDTRQTLEWDQLVLATGSRARRIPGDACVGVHRLRSITDAVALRRDLRPGRHLAIVGAGFVGLEVASTARELGLEVTVIARESVPLARAVGPEVGALLAARASASGVRMLTGVRSTSIRRGAGGRVEAVTLGGRGEVACDVALIAIGAEPASELAVGLVALATDGGIATDQAGRTDHPGVFACGDVASAWRPWLGRCLSIGHWTSAAAGAQAVAAAVLGAPPPAHSVPYAWSDAFGLRIQQVGGAPPPGAELVLDTSADDFEASYLVDGEVCCVVTGNRPQRAASARRELAASPRHDFGETADHGLATSTAPR